MLGPGYRKAAVVVRVVCAGMGRETLWQNYDSTAALRARSAYRERVDRDTIDARFTFDRALDALALRLADAQRELCRATMKL